MAVSYRYDLSEYLRKGQTIPQSVVEAATGQRYVEDPELYRLAALGLCGRIEKSTGLHTAIQGRNIRVLTDLESDYKTLRGAMNGAAAIHRANDRRTRIDRSTFTPEQQREAETRDNVTTSYSFAVLNTRRRLARDEHIKAALNSQRKQLK
jgi:hypothetical protein